MKKVYEIPEFEVEKFEVSDILTTGGSYVPGDDELPGI